MQKICHFFNNNFHFRKRKRKSTQPPCTHPLDLFYILTLFWSWQTVWDTKLLSWTNHQPKIKTCFNYCIAASKCASVCKFCRKMSGITLPRTPLLKNTTSINRNKWNSFTVYIYLPLHNVLKLILKEHSSSELNSIHCLQIGYLFIRELIFAAAAVSLVYSRNRWFISRLEMALF